jgi:hypothetical protein
MSLGTYSKLSYTQHNGINNFEANVILRSGKTVCGESKITKEEIIPIIIDKHFNNIAFGKSISCDCGANFTGSGYYFLSDNAPAAGDMKLENMKFKFPLVGAGSVDNISCDDQEIEVAPGFYNSIQLLGTAEYGDFTDHLTVEYENGDRKNVGIAFSEWWRSDPVYNEKIAWKGKIVEKREEKASVIDRDHHIYAIERPIGNNGRITKIILPFCPNIHIFSISLCG